MSEAYSEFARVYDLFQDNVNYERWADYLTERLRELQITEGLVLELGCGTGTMTELLAGAGYDMIGVDNSQDMLAEAMEKREGSGHDILYLLQDMQEFELYGTVRAVVSVCDSLNYLMEEEELAQVFSLVNNYLDPGGVFLFDMNTEYKYREVIGNSVIAENRPEGSFIWENTFDEESGINEYALTLFLPAKDGLYEKWEELHYQRAYSLERIKELLAASGLVLTAVYDAYTLDPPREDSGRLTFVAREHGKTVPPVQEVHDERRKHE
ncbi:MAG: class I SAM-dependent methyltransferase [Eubacteriales bacterium]|nr:class I SAM-dependent methyltransferase [Eubacteriales bacterium]